MVKNTSFIVLATFLVGLTASVVLVSAEFTASVSSNQVCVNESFSLNLTLKDASPKQTPALSALKNQFLTHSVHHSTNTTVVNGKVSSSIIWHISLRPKTEGILEIPPITVDTTEGPLSTLPITLTSVKNSSSQSHEENMGLTLLTKVSNASPYKNESFLYTAFLTSKMPLYHVQTQKIEVDDAIVELIEEPKLEEKVIEGVLLHVVEFNYLITPLKSGSFTIPSISLQGAVPQKRKAQFNSFYNDGLDPFALLQGYDSLKPFHLMTEAIQLDIQPVNPSVSPWLPAKTLTIEEQWPKDPILRVGEPFSRNFLIKAEGLKASQLPHLDDLQKQGSHFKVYADKPEDEEKVTDGTVFSMRKEQYTLIPQQDGTCVLPEISIQWWDSNKKEKKICTIPERTLHILPAIETETSTARQDIVAQPMAPTIPIPHSSARPLYGIIGILTALLLAALLWGFTLQRKLASLTQSPLGKKQQPEKSKKLQSPPPKIKFQKDKKEKLPDLNPT